MDLLNTFASLFSNFGNLTWQMVVMWGIGALLIYLAIAKKMEPSLLLPMGFGAILVNLPLSGAITQDMAKKLCKLHHTAVSAAYNPQPFDWDVLLGLLHKKPLRRSSYEAQLSDSDSLVTTTQIAKEYGCGAKVFNRLLHLHGIQYRANGQWVLYSEHHGKGYTSSLTFRLQRSDGSEVEKLHTAWTQKGRKFLYHTLKRRGVLPLAEQGG